MARIVFLVTSYDRLLDGEPTGSWLAEFAEPWNLLERGGHELEVVSPAGGAAPVEPASAPLVGARPQWDGPLARLEATRPIDAVAADDCAAVFVVGGRGALFDLPYDRRVHRLLRGVVDGGGLITCTSQAGAVLAGMMRPDGCPYAAGRLVTSTTDAEEAAAGRADKLPILAEARLRAAGARHSSARPGKPHVVREDELITAQNPASAGRAAEMLARGLSLATRAAVVA